MRLFQRENGIWYVEFGRGKKRSLGTRSKQEAIRTFNQLKREQIAGRLNIPSRKKILLSTFSKEYLEWCENNRSTETFKKARHCLKRLQEIIGDIYLYNISRKHLDDYVSHLLSWGISKVTINVHIRTLKSAFSKAVEWEYLEKNPFLGYKQLKVQQKPPRFLLPEEVEKIEEMIDDEMWIFIFRFFIYTGLRLGELVTIRWKDIDFNRDILTVRKSKNFQSRVIPLHPKLKSELMKYYQGKEEEKIVPYSKSYIEHKLKMYFRRAGFHDLRIHDLRHTFASLMVMNGVDLKTVQELLGHTSYKTTEIYAHLAPHHLQQAIKKFPL
ncbi:MAG: hypothetical protein DSY34_04545 [Desulfurobacterium sp.]|nr:MAG: hypothetical protein DSY34_04545 [Desulfurobacterium sp.]